MNERFARVGLGYRFAPTEAPAVFVFSRPRESGGDLSFEIAVQRPDGRQVMTRRVNLMTGFKQGSLKNLAAELEDEVKSVAWPQLLREACESVIASHRNGMAILTTRGAFPRPPAPEWLCYELLLKGKANTWFGAASTGKSTLAKAVCLHYACGLPFVGRAIQQGVPLYLDWEEDHADFERVVFDLAQHLRVYPPPQLHWANMRGKRLRDQVQQLAEVIDRLGVGLVVLDAVAAAGGSPGEHMSWEGIALELEECLGQLPPVTVLGLDHSTSDEYKAGEAPRKARGAIRKVEFFRNQWSLASDRDDQESGRHVVHWRHEKINVGPKAKPFSVELIHHDGDLAIVSTEAGFKGEPTSDTDAMLGYLKRHGPANTGQVAQYLRTSAAHVRNYGKRLSERGLVTRIGGDDSTGTTVWAAVEA